MRTYLLLILLLSSISSISQDCDNTLFGTVTDLHDGSLLVGATLIFVGTEQAVQTDLDGNFSISKLCNDRYSIQISHPFCLTNPVQHQDLAHIPEFSSLAEDGVRSLV